MKFSRGFFSTVAVLVAVAVMLMSGSPASAEQQFPNTMTPPACAADFVNCTMNNKINVTEIMENPDTPYKNKCCTFFDDMVNNDKECVCTNFVHPAKQYNYTTITDSLFTSCNITITPDNLCKDVSSSGSGSGNGSKGNGAERMTCVGLVSSVVLLIWAMVS